MIDIEFKKALIENRMFNVVSYESFYNNKEQNMNSLTAVEKDGYLYPVRTSSDTKPGLYNAGCIDFFVDPDEDNRHEYDVSHINDIGGSDSLEEMMNTIKDINLLERKILTSPDNITIPVRSDKDTPAMAGLKDAVECKQIDINKYRDRFGAASFPNDKRKLNDNDISFKMLNRYTSALDIKATLILEDTNPDIPNPMGTKIVIDLSGYDDTI